MSNGNNVIVAVKNGNSDDALELIKESAKNEVTEAYEQLPQTDRLARELTEVPPDVENMAKKQSDMDNNRQQD